MLGRRGHLRTAIAISAVLSIALVAGACASSPAATPRAPSPSSSGRAVEDPGPNLVESILTGAEARAADREAQAAARNGLVAAMVFYIDNDETYLGVTGEDLGMIEPTLTFRTGKSTGPDVISFSAKDRRFTLAALSRTGTCFALRSDDVGAVSYGQIEDADTCRPKAFPNDIFSSSW